MLKLIGKKIITLVLWNFCRYGPMIDSSRWSDGLQILIKFHNHNDSKYVVGTKKNFFPQDGYFDYLNICFACKVLYETCFMFI